jgi:hypothetical protein
MRRFSIICLFLGASIAWAVSKDFNEAFPAIVCADGWAGCMIDGEHEVVDSVKDSGGVFHPTDSRVSFFTFEPLTHFSPFMPLSEYKDTVVAVRVEPITEEEEEKVEKQKINRVREERKTKEREPQKYIQEPKSVDNQERDNQKDEAEERRKQEAETERLRLEAEEAERLSKEEEQKKLEQEELAKKEQEELAKKEQEEKDKELLPPTGCSDLIALEGLAMIGQLEKSHKDCLEKKISGSGSLTQKRKVSLILINNAENARQSSEWRRLVDRHLRKIDQSDPNLCLRYAYKQSKRGSHSSVIKWADTALDNKHVWKGNEYKKNVYMLYQLKATAANKQWQSAEKKLVEERTPENQAKAEKYRGKAKNFAREWLDYARASGQATKNPTTLCVSATQGDLNFCK